MLITWCIAFPLVAALVVALCPRGTERLMWLTALTGTLFALGVGILMFRAFDPARADLQFEEYVPWIEKFGASWHVGVDGLSLLMLMLTLLLGPVVLLASSSLIKKHVKEYLLAMLVLQAAMAGVFTSWDMLLFYVFWEAVLIPMYLLIGVWGSGDRIYATLKFFLYTLTASLLMLAAIVVLYVMCGSSSFDFEHFFASVPALGLTLETQWILFGAFALAFAVKIPVFPFHTWLPDAHTEAPMAGSVILAGVTLKMGAYGMLRLAFPLFPSALVATLPLLMLLAVVGIVYGALVAMAQTDVKRLVAYSSVSHLGFVLLGMAVLNTQGLEGALLQMVNHGLSTGALFMAVGFLYERSHSRRIDEHAGLAESMPRWALVFALAMLSSIALPGLNGFVGEFLILLGAFRTEPLYAAAAATGMVLSAAYMLWLYKRIAWGRPPADSRQTQFTDLNWKETLSFIPLLALMVWIGVYPNFFLGKIRASSAAWLERMHASINVPHLRAPMRPGLPNEQFDALEETP
jgi:NADH-quinone oxidoreductase subunit M